MRESERDSRWMSRDSTETHPDRAAPASASPTPPEKCGSQEHATFSTLSSTALSGVAEHQEVREGRGRGRGEGEGEERELVRLTPSLTNSMRRRPVLPIDSGQSLNWVPLHRGKCCKACETHTSNQHTDISNSGEGHRLDSEKHSLTRPELSRPLPPDRVPFFGSTPQSSTLHARSGAFFGWEDRA